MDQRFRQLFYSVALILLTRPIPATPSPTDHLYFAAIIKKPHLGPELEYILGKNPKQSGSYLVSQFEQGVLVATTPISENEAKGWTQDLISGVTKLPAKGGRLSDDLIQWTVKCGERESQGTIVIEDDGNSADGNTIGALNLFEAHVLNKRLQDWAK